MKAWLRSNRVGLVAVAILLPATVGITFANEWTAYFGQRPSVPVDVAPGDTGTFAATDWVVEDTERIPAAGAEGEEIGLPAGSELVVVSVRVTPGDLDSNGESPRCLLDLEELDGGTVTRGWGDALSDPISFDTADGAESICTASNTDPYLLETIFVVPADAGDELALAVTVVGELPEYLRLRL